MNKKELQKQFQFLGKLRKLSVPKLRAYHDKVFVDTPFYVILPSDIHKDVIIQRLFYYYSAKICPCYDRGTPELQKFRRIAAEKLSNNFIQKNRDPALLNKRTVGLRAVFTRQHIARMNTEEVAGYLAAIGYHLDDSVTLPERRMCLWEWANGRASNLPRIEGKNVRRGYKTGLAVNNKYILVDLIRMYPDMGWPEFEETFSDLMPHVTKSSFYNGRWRARQLGGIPKLLSGRRKPRNNSKEFDDSEYVEAKSVKFSDLDVLENFKN